MTESLRNFYEKIILLGEFLGHFLLFAMRLYWGYAFFKAGYGKFGNIDNITSFFGSLNIPLPMINAYLVATVEMIGGLCLMFGFATRLIAIPLVITMVTALFTAHGEAVWNVLDNPKNLIDQTPFNYLLTSLIVFCFGPGGISLDYLFKRFIFKKS